MISFIKKYQILLCFFIAFIIARFYPGLGVRMSDLGLLNVFIVIMFVCIGLTFDTNKMKNIFFKNILLALLWSLIASSLLSPAIGYFVIKKMGFAPEILIGFILICASTPTLVAGPIMAYQLGGNFEISTALSTIVKIIGIFLIPPVLVLFLGTMADIKQGSLILKMVYLLIIPGLIGQGIRLINKKNVVKQNALINWVVLFSNFILVYMAFSCMHEQLCKLTLENVLLLIGPCLIIHFIHMFITGKVSKHIFRLPRDIRVSVIITACQKNMAIPLSIWVACFMKSFPGAILIVVVYYLVQFFVDSCFLEMYEIAKAKSKIG